MEDLIEYLTTDEIVNKGFDAVALAQFLASKGIIDLDEFFQFRDKYVRILIAKRFPELFEQNP